MNYINYKEFSKKNIEYVSNDNELNEVILNIKAYGAFLTLEDRKPIFGGFIARKYGVVKLFDEEAYMNIINNYLLKRKLRVKLVEKGNKEKVRKI